MRGAVATSLVIAALLALTSRAAGGGRAAGAIVATLPGVFTPLGSQPACDARLGQAAEGYCRDLFATLASLDRFWRASYPPTRRAHTSVRASYRPPVGLYRYPGGECGRDPLACTPGAYLPQYGVVALNEPWLLRWHATNRVAPAIVIAHEWGHRVQALLPGIPVAPPGRGLLRYLPYTIHTELQADCFAGAWSAFAERRGLIHPGELGPALEAAFGPFASVFESELADWRLPGRHGEPVQRILAFRSGHDLGATACRAWLDYAGQGVRTLGRFRIAIWPRDLATPAGARRLSITPGFTLGDARTAVAELHLLASTAARAGGQLARVAHLVLGADARLFHDPSAVPGIRVPRGASGAIQRYELRSGARHAHGVLYLIGLPRTGGRAAQLLVIDVRDAGPAARGWDGIDDRLNILLLGLEAS